MALSRIYVQGTELKWEDAGLTFRTTGARPAPSEEQFAGQPVGRIWVSDKYLYYSDYLGEARFVHGIQKSPTGSNIPSGRVFTNSGRCLEGTGSNLYWSGINTPYYHMVRAETVAESYDVTLTTGFTFTGTVGDAITGSYYAMLSEPINEDISVYGLSVQGYTATTCATATAHTDTLLEGNLVIPAGSTLAEYAITAFGDATDVGLKLLSTSLSIGKTPSNYVARVHNEQFCHIPSNAVPGFSGPGPDVVRVIVVAECEPVGSVGEQECGESCLPGGLLTTERCAPLSGCTCLLDTPGNWTCQSESYGGGISENCGQACTTTDDCAAFAAGECLDCDANICRQLEF